MDSFSRSIEDIILTHGSRGMERIRGALAVGYCRRAADIVLAHRGCVVMGTGFPVIGSFETDGPLGAIALYQVLETLGSQPVFVCAPPISRVLQPRYRTREVPILGWQESIPVMAVAFAELRPALMVAIERPGVAADGRYYNMRRQDISASVAKLDLLFMQAACPRICVGDGGNEIGMGKIGAVLAELPIIPAVTPCEELIIATVSNWGVYGLIAALSERVGKDLFRAFDPIAILDYLVRQGAVDGTTGIAECTEDGFPLDVGLGIIAQLRERLAEQGIYSSGSKTAVK